MKYSITEIIAAVIGFLGFLKLISDLINHFFGFKKRLQEPEEAQNTEIENLKKELAETQQALAAVKFTLENDYSRRIRTLEDSHRIMLRGMSALLSHGINGNNVTEMEKVKTELDNYIYNRE